MQEPADTELLRQYTENGSESAFETLVSRHVGLVYSAALRKTGNAHTAEEITQAVFIILAKKAGTLRKGTILTGWLYQAARLTAANYLRNEIRRTHREQEAHMQSHPEEPEVWSQIVPLLDDAMGRLNENERNAVLLRFFEGKSFQEIAAASGASENAAKKRVAYALEKLRKFFAGRGVASTGNAIAGAISTNSLNAVPAGLAKSISTLALAKGAVASASTLTLVNGVLKIMAWSTTKTAVVTGAAVLFVAATATVMIKADYSHQTQSGPAAAFNESLNGTDSVPQIKLGDTLNGANREALRDPQVAKLRAEVWPREIEAAEQKILEGQKTDLTSNAVMIDLSPYIDAKLSDGTVGGKANNFADLPLGAHIYGGVPFNVSGAIYLMGGWLAHYGKECPEEVDGIRVGCRCQKIHLFHGESFVFFGMWGNTVSKLILHYEDGSTNELDLVAGQQAFDFWSPLFTTGVSAANLACAPGTVLAWSGSNPMIQKLQPDESLVLLRTTFDNPQPALKLVSVDYVSNDTMTVPVLFGLTVE